MSLTSVVTKTSIREDLKRGATWLQMCGGSIADATLSKSSIHSLGPSVVTLVIVTLVRSLPSSIYAKYFTGPTAKPGQFISFFSSNVLVFIVCDRPIKNINQ